MNSCVSNHRRKEDSSNRNKISWRTFSRTLIKSKNRNWSRAVSNRNFMSWFLNFYLLIRDKFWISIVHTNFTMSSIILALLWSTVNQRHVSSSTDNLIVLMTTYITWVTGNSEEGLYISHSYYNSFHCYKWTYFLSSQRPHWLSVIFTTRTRDDDQIEISSKFFWKLLLWLNERFSCLLSSFNILKTLTCNYIFSIVDHILRLELFRWL